MKPQPRPAVHSAALALALVAGLAAPAAAAPPRLVPEASEIVFTSRQMGVPVDGRFGRFGAELAFDPRAPEATRVAVRVELGSVAIGTAEVEAELRKPEWFAAAAFPQAEFRSRTVRVPAPGRLEVRGTLAIKGLARELEVPVTLAQEGSRATATGRFAMRRLDWRIGDGDWNDPALVADEVQVRFRLVFDGVAAR